MTTTHLRLAKIGGITGGILALVGPFVVPNELLYEKRSSSELYLENHPEVRVREVWSMKLNGRINSCGPRRWALTHEGICFVTLEGEGWKRRVIAHRVQIRSGKDIDATVRIN